MIRKIRFDSGTTINKFNNYRKNVSFGSDLIKYGIPNRWHESPGPRNTDSFSPHTDNEERNEPPIVKYGYPEILPQSKNKDTDEVARAISQTPVSREEDYDELAKSVNEDLFGNDEEDEAETVKEKADKQKPSYFKRLWYAIIGKDVK
ncbi:hypothetical protein IJS77_04110 [bacterium]|nr:hypothetical protein [bacterium]